ncbi:MAG: hypothetical protein R6U11_11270 [Bacteroidales bacterium]
MKVKGTAVKTIPEFIKSVNAEKYKEWMSQLPDKSKAIFIEGALSSEWYPIEDAIIQPTKLMSEICYNHPTKGAWECGRYSAEASLKGIYKFYVKMSSPGHIIDRAGRILQAYYDPSELSVVSKGKQHVTLHITKFPKPDDIVEHRLAGWMEKALEISGCKDVNIKIPQSLTKGHRYTEFAITWN